MRDGRLFAAFGLGKTCTWSHRGGLLGSTFDPFGLGKLVPWRFVGNCVRCVTLFIPNFLHEGLDKFFGRIRCEGRLGDFVAFYAVSRTR